MTKDQLVQYGLISLGIVAGAWVFGHAAFAWLEGLMFKKSKDERTIEELVRTKRYAMGGLSEAAAAREKLTNKKQDPRALADEREEDPAEIKKREIMQRIFVIELRRFPNETEDTYHLRMLGLKSAENLEVVKKAFKQKAKELHPDMFQLDTFEGRARKRLMTRVHENYLAIQKAQDYFKKKLS